MTDVSRKDWRSHYGTFLGFFLAFQEISMSINAQMSPVPDTYKNSLDQCDIAIFKLQRNCSGKEVLLYMNLVECGGPRNFD